MRNKISGTMSGWSPIFDTVVQEVGLMTASVYGVIWRHCQMRNGECTASQETLAGKIGITIRSLQRHAEKLIDAGFLSKVTDTGVGTTYSDNEKMNIRVAVYAQEGTTESRTPYVRGSQVGTSEGRTSRQVKETMEESSNKEIYVELDENGVPLEKPVQPKRKKARVQPPDLFLMAEALAEVTGMSLPANKSRIFAEAKLLMADKRVSPTLIRIHYGVGSVWYLADWRGKTGQRPKLHEIRPTLFTFVLPDTKNVIKGGVKDRG